MRRWLMRICGWFGHARVPWSRTDVYDNVTLRWHGRRCVICGWVRATTEPVYRNDLDPETELRLRAAFDQADAKLRPEGGRLDYRTIDVEDDDDAD